MATARNRRRTQAEEAHEAPPAVREPIEIPDFDFHDMVWGFLFAASVGSGNAAGAIACAAGFVVQKQVRSDPATLQRVADYAMALVPGLEGGTRLALPWPKRSAEYLTTSAAPLVRRPDTVGDSNGDGAAEGRTVRLQAAPCKAETATRPRWLEVTNDHPDQHPHTLILGPTGAGKTTMARAIIGDRGGRTVVLAPKISNKGWKGSGAEVISLDRDATYAPITQALRDLDEEKRERSRRLQDEDDPRFEPLTIVLDDIQDLVVMEPDAGALMVNLSSIGRELNMRLIGIGTTDDALNIRGWKASRNNYVRIETDVDRRGTLSDGKRTFTVQAQESKRLAEAARLRPWRGEPEPAPARAVAADAPRAEVVSVRVPERRAAPDDLLAGLLAAPAPAAKPSLDERIAAALRAGEQAEAAVRVERAEGSGDVYVFAGAKAEAAPAARPARPPRRTGAIDMAARRRDLERKAYYQQAARDGVTLQSAYEARPKGERGNYNDAARWYREEKARIKAS